MSAQTPQSPQSPLSRPLLPVFLKLEGRRALVVGGGPIGARKANELLEVGARVVAVSPAFCDAFPAHGVERHVRAFAPGDAHGAAIVFACTGDVAVDDAVSQDAVAHGALVNVVDRPKVSTFYSAATLRRGPVVVAVGTSGASPGLARKVRDKIEEALPPAVGLLGDALGSARARLLARHPSLDARARVVDAFLERAWQRFCTGAAGDDVTGEIARALERELLAAPDPPREGASCT